MQREPKISDGTPTSFAPAATLNPQPVPEKIHPHALLVSWEMHTRSGQWQAAHDLAQALVAALPGEPIGWIYRAFALQKLGRFPEARQHLLAAARRFPADWRIAYNLACCVCQMGDMAGVWHWLERAIELGDADAVKSLALDEPSLKPLWEKVGQRLLVTKEGCEASFAA